MIAKLNGKPLTSTEGDLNISRTKPVKSVKAFVKEAMRKQPMIIVLRHVRPKSATFAQGNFCGEASSKNISADGLRELFMKRILRLPLISLGRRSLERLQVFA